MSDFVVSEWYDADRVEIVSARDPTRCKEGRP